MVRDRVPGPEVLGSYLYFLIHYFLIHAAARTGYLKGRRACLCAEASDLRYKQGKANSRVL